METEMTYDNYLAHYGVKGMKWGNRKSANRGTGSQRKRSSSTRQKGSESTTGTAKKSKKQKAKEFYGKHKSTINAAAGAVTVAGAVGVGYALKSKQANYGKHTVKSVKKNGSLEMGRTVSSITKLHQKQAVFDALGKEAVSSKNFDRDHVLQNIMTKQANGVDLLKPGNLTRREQGRLDEAIYKHGMKSKNNKVALGLAMNIAQNQPNGYNINKAYGVGTRRHAKRG